MLYSCLHRMHTRHNTKLPKQEVFNVLTLFPKKLLKCVLSTKTLTFQLPSAPPSFSGVPPPGQIQFPSVQPYSVTLRWSPPEGAPGPHRYRVTWRRGQEQHSTPVTGSEVVVTGLLPASKYHFTVVTLSDDGRQSPCVDGSVHTGED